MKTVWDSISSHPIFTLIAGLSSLVSLVLSITNDKFFIWVLLTLICAVILLLLFLLNTNSKVLQNTNLVIGQMNTVKLDVFQSSLELELSPTGDFISKSDLFIVVSSVCTPEKVEENPNAIVKLQYPSQIKMKFNLGKGIKKLQGQANNTCSFLVELGKGSQFISLNSILVKNEDEQHFKESSKLIEISVSSECFDKKISLDESIIIENLGW
ncbi:hypothetical protein [Sporosarcina koreensis]|uniref:Uncharacterized protein n=1 Tax=Sporosarcina koreensis TaxID=334735 RepID=A0ABW0TYZ2_9BACL